MEKLWLGTLLLSELPLHGGPLCPQADDRGSFPSHAGPSHPPFLPTLGGAHRAVHAGTQRDTVQAVKLNLRSVSSPDRTLRFYFWFNSIPSIADANLMKFHFLTLKSRFLYLVLRTLLAT